MKRHGRVLYVIGEDRQSMRRPTCAVKLKGPWGWFWNRRPRR